MCQCVTWQTICIWCRCATSPTHTVPSIELAFVTEEYAKKVSHLTKQYRNELKSYPRSPILSVARKLFIQFTVNISNFGFYAHGIYYYYHSAVAADSNSFSTV